MEYVNSLERIIDINLSGFLHGLSILIVAYIGSFILILKRKYVKRCILAIILSSFFFLTRTMIYHGMPLILAQADYKHSQYIELEGIVTDISGDNSNIFIYIDGEKFIQPRNKHYRSIKTNLEVNDRVKIIYGEKSKYIISIIIYDK